MTAVKPQNLLSLVDQGEPTKNLNSFMNDLRCSDNNIAWLALFSAKVEKYSDVTTLNLYEQMRMFVEVRKLLPNIVKLNENLTNAMKSMRSVCQTWKFDYTLGLAENLQRHRLSCKSCFNQPVQKEPTVNSDVKRLMLEYYPRHIVSYARSFDNCERCTLRCISVGVIECILCKCTFSECKNWDELDKHLQSKTHAGKISIHRRNLARFHDFWSKQPLDVWKRHLQFKFSSSRLQCMLCGVRVEYEDVCDHLSSCLDSKQEPEDNSGNPRNIESSQTANSTHAMQEHLDRTSSKPAEEDEVRNHLERASHLRKANDTQVKSEDWNAQLYTDEINHEPLVKKIRIKEEPIRDKQQFGYSFF